jgi:hypothetical protein
MSQKDEMPEELIVEKLPETVAPDDLDAMKVGTGDPVDVEALFAQEPDRAGDQQPVKGLRLAQRRRWYLAIPGLAALIAAAVWVRRRVLG